MKIKVTTARPSFRRAGIDFSREPTILDTADLTQAQLASIQAEPHLNVQAVEEKKADKKAEKEAAEKATAEKAAAEKKAAAQ